MESSPDDGVRAESGSGATEFENLFSWSVSRHRVFKECRRAYYFRHYGSWGGWRPDADPRTREIYVLKKLSNRFALAGSVVHQVVADVFSRHRYGREVALAEAKARALALLRTGFLESREGEYRRRKAVGLFEHEYEEPVSGSEWERMRDRVYQCLDNFFASQVKDIILDTKIENWLPIDAMDSFEFEKTKVYVAPDFALRNPQGNALLIDWKTGRAGPGDDRMQIVCYGLFAREKWSLDPKRAIGELHYLLSRDTFIVTLDENALEEGVEMMRTSISAMRALLDDPETNTATMERFPQTDDRGVCGRCNYRRICWPQWPDTH